MAVKKAAPRSRKAAAAAKVEEPDESVDDEPQPSPADEVDRAPAGILDSVQGEIILLKALSKHRPLGITRHFEMAALLGAVNAQLEVSALEGAADGVEGPEVWEKLKSMWDMERLNGDITPPFPSPPLSPPPPPEPDLSTFHLPLNGSFDSLVDARRLHSAGSRSPPTGSPPSRHAALAGKDVVGDSGSSLTGTEGDEDEEMAEPEVKEESDEDEEVEETEEEESEEELTPVKKRKKARRR